MAWRLGSYSMLGKALRGTGIGCSCSSGAASITISTVSVAATFWALTGGSGSCQLQQGKMRLKIFRHIASSRAGVRLARWGRAGPPSQLGAQLQIAEEQLPLSQLVPVSVASRRRRIDCPAIKHSRRLHAPHSCSRTLARCAPAWPSTSAAFKRPRSARITIAARPRTTTAITGIRWWLSANWALLRPWPSGAAPLGPCRGQRSCQLAQLPQLPQLGHWAAGGSASCCGSDAIHTRPWSGTIRSWRRLASNCRSLPGAKGKAKDICMGYMYVHIHL